MIFREAQITDIRQLMEVRFAVKENMLSNPALVTEDDCEDYLLNRGKGWVCLEKDAVVGFAIADLVKHNVWALFVHPDYARKGIGKRLHRLMLHWYFGETKETIWLGTAPSTKAEKFYRMQGWEKTGFHGTKEIKFEMTFAAWQRKKSDAIEQ